MNINNRVSLNDYHAIRQTDKVTRVQHFEDIKRTLTVGMSTIYTAIAQVDCNNGIKKGDKVYFKINNNLGYNDHGRIDETQGSCEDVAEVLGFYALRNLGKTLGKQSILQTTPYEFAEYSCNDFMGIISKKTHGFVQDDRLYGCISRNCLNDDEEIIHGDSLLSLIMPKYELDRLSNNSLANYNYALGQLPINASKIGQEIIINPICIRYLANTMFWDYFFTNSDRHCKNINLLKSTLPDGRILVQPMPIIDNGDGFRLGSSNCYNLFLHHCAHVREDNLEVLLNMSSHNPFNTVPSFSVGKQSLLDEDLKSAYDPTNPSSQIVSLISGSVTLFNDFSNMYKNLDLVKAFEDMTTELKFNMKFLPNLETVAKGVLSVKKAQISREMANQMQEEFSFETFRENPNHYLDKFESYVKDNNLSLHIATDEEVEEFNDQISAITKPFGQDIGAVEEVENVSTERQDVDCSTNDNLQGFEVLVQEQPDETTQEQLQSYLNKRTSENRTTIQSDTQTETIIQNANADLLQ